MVFNWLAGVQAACGLGLGAKSNRKVRTRALYSGSVIIEGLEARRVLSPMISGVETSAASQSANGSATAVTSGLTVSDGNSTTIHGATVSLGSTYRSGEDVLSFQNTPNITGNFNASTGTLTLSGTDTLANYQSALRSVMYQDTSADPTANIRRVSFTVNDGATDSASANRYINMSSQISNLETSTQSYSTGSGSSQLTNTLTLANTASGNVNGATVKLDANYVNGQDVLSFTNTPTITGNFDSSTGTLTLTGTGTTANYQAALRSVTYNNTSSSPTAGVRRFAFTVDGATDSNYTADRYFTVGGSSSSSGPVISGVETTSGSQAASGTATPVTSSLTLTDSGSTSIQGATVSLGSTFRPGEDVLSFTNTPNITGSFNSSTGILTLTGTDTAANYQNALRSITYSDSSANPTPNVRRVTFTVNDGSHSSTSVNRYINMTSLISNVETSTQAYSGTGNSALTNTLTLGNTASGNINGATVKLDANYVNGQDVLSFTNTPNITGNFNASTGTLTLTGSDTAANYQAALRSVQYHNTSSTPTTGIRRFAITVDGATSSTFTANRYFNVGNASSSSGPVISGVETTAGSQAASGTATPVTSSLTLNDASSTTINGATISLGSTFRSGEDVLSFTNTPNITGSYNSSTGTLTLTGTDTTANYQNALRSITYSDSSANPTPNIRRVTFTVNDGSSASTSANRYINMTSLISNVETSTQAYTAGSGSSQLTNTLTLANTASGTINGATIKLDANYVNGQDVLSFTNTPNITGNFDAATGTLTLTGTDTSANYQAALRSITYDNTSSTATTGVRRFAITVDGATSSNFTANRYFNVGSSSSSTTGPVISGVESSSGSFTAGGSATPVTSSLTVNDTSSATLTGATVSLGSSFQSGEDVLSFTNTPNINGSFDSSTGTLTLTGTDTLSNYENALRSVTYQDNSVNPNSSARNVAFTVNDGASTSGSVNRSIDVSSQISNLETATQVYPTGSGATPITNTLTLGSTASGNMNGATVQLNANYVGGEDVLGFTNTPNITGNFDASTGTLTLSGTDTSASYQAALRSVTYTDTSLTPTLGIRGINISVDGATNSSLSANRYFNVT